MRSARDAQTHTLNTPHYTPHTTTHHYTPHTTLHTLIPSNPATIRLGHLVPLRAPLGRRGPHRVAQAPRALPRAAPRPQAGRQGARRRLRRRRAAARDRALQRRAHHGCADAAVVVALLLGFGLLLWLLRCVVLVAAVHGMCALQRRRARFASRSAIPSATPPPSLTTPAQTPQHPGKTKPNQNKPKQTNATGLNNNSYQISRGLYHNNRAGHGITETCGFVKADFMRMPFEDASFDAVYEIDATCHAPDQVRFACVVCV